MLGKYFILENKISLRLALDKELHFLPCGWVTGLVITLCGPVADVIETI